MKAVAVTDIGGPERLALMDLPVPAPAPGEVLVRVEAAGVNEVDTMFREGYLDTGARPLIMGSDFSGVVERVGDGVDDLAPGDEVYGYKLLGNGTYAEFVAVRSDWVARKPASLSHVEAAALPCVGLTAYQAVVDALDVRAGETVVITGAAGGVGTVAVQLAVDRGARVIGTASARNESYVRDLGAEEFVDYTAGDWVEAVRALHPEGVDVVFTAIGGETKRQSPKVLRDGGRLVWITGDDKPGPPMQRFVAGNYVGGVPSRATLEALAALADVGRLRVSVEHAYALDDARAAQLKVVDGHVRGKLVIQVGAVTTDGPATTSAAVAS
jgi:NADPH:quinone reductase-like Zn-dependent oxidoreductase